MWEPQRLTALYASMACYRDSFTFYLYNTSYNDNTIKPYHYMLLLWHTLHECLHQEVWELVVMVGARPTAHIRVETLLLLHHSWGPCSQLRQLSKVVDFENEADRLEHDSGWKNMKQIVESRFLYWFWIFCGSRCITHIRLFCISDTADSLNKRYNLIIYIEHVSITPWFYASWTLCQHVSLAPITFNFQLISYNILHFKTNIQM
jgi:hypothetical protein